MTLGFRIFVDLVLVGIAFDFTYHQAWKTQGKKVVSAILVALAVGGLLASETYLETQKKKHQEMLARLPLCNRASDVIYSLNTDADVLNARLLAAVAGPSDMTSEELRRFSAQTPQQQLDELRRKEIEGFRPLEDEYKQRYNTEIPQLDQLNSEVLSLMGKTSTDQDHVLINSPGLPRTPLTMGVLEMVADHFRDLYNELGCPAPALKPFWAKQK